MKSEMFASSWKGGMGKGVKKDESLEELLKSVCYELGEKWITRISISSWMVNRKAKLFVHLVLYFYFSLSLFFFFFPFWLFLLLVEVPRPGIKPVPHRDPSHSVAIPDP